MIDSRSSDESGRPVTAVASLRVCVVAVAAVDEERSYARETSPHVDRGAFE